MKTTSATLQNGKCTSQQQSESRTMFSLHSMFGFRFAIHGGNHLKQNKNCMFKKKQDVQLPSFNILIYFEYRNVFTVFFSHNKSCFALPSRPASVPIAGPNIDQENNHRTYMLYPRF